jgi:hypothetical protein
MMFGTVKFSRSDKHFGFIVRDDGQATNVRISELPLACVDWSSSAPAPARMYGGDCGGPSNKWAALFPP